MEPNTRGGSFSERSYGDRDGKRGSRTERTH